MKRKIDETATVASAPLVNTATSAYDVVISGINIPFPRRVYNCQLEYMKCIIEALNRSENALLESPTGTGKTLCLLCATLAWRQHQKQLNPDVNYCIIYTSRTHSQLTQVIRELRNTIHRPKITVLGSRDQLCVNDKLKSKYHGLALNRACSTACTNRQCSYRNNLSNYIYSLSSRSSQPTLMDIEDLVRIGKSESICPYYLSHEVAGCDLIFSPYWYIFDVYNPVLASLSSLENRKFILIIDEGHNIDGAVTSSSSVSLTATDIAISVHDCDLLLSLSSNVLDVALTKKMLLQLEERLDHDIVDTGIWMRRMLEDICVDLVEMSQILSRVSEMMIDAKNDGMEPKIALVHKLIKAVSAVYDTQVLLTHYRSVIDDKKLSFVCLHTGTAMNMALSSSSLLANLTSIILTSGTLNPIRSFERELSCPGLSWPICFEGNHVCNVNRQLYMAIIKSYKTETLESSYSRRSESSYIHAIGGVVSDITSSLPSGGSIIFFPSFELLNTCVTSWKQSGVYNRLLTSFPVVVESRDHSDAIQQYSSHVTRLGSCMLMAVCRGKASEGMDFRDDMCRCVVIVGIPYPPLNDKIVELKRAYMDSRRNEGCESGWDWYKIQAIRSVSQSIGRVLRHVSDYGCVFLLDKRYTEISHHLPKWIKPALRNQKEFTDETVVELRAFFDLNRNSSTLIVDVPSLPTVSVDAADIPMVTKTTVKSISSSSSSKGQPSQAIVRSFGLVKSSSSSLVLPSSSSSLDAFMSELSANAWQDDNDDDECLLLHLSSKFRRITAVMSRNDQQEALESALSLISSDKLKKVFARNQMTSSIIIRAPTVIDSSRLVSESKSSKTSRLSQEPKELGILSQIDLMERVMEERHAESHYGLCHACYGNKALLCPRVCRHAYFCSVCWKKWLDRSRTCPVCRIDVCFEDLVEL